MSQTGALRVLISGGGSGGHIYPALAIAEALRAEKPDVEFLFVGAEGKMEMKRVPSAGHNIVGLPIAGLHRKLDVRNLSFPWKLVKSLAKAKRVVADYSPHLAIGTGGFASGPALAAAAAQGIPVFLQEQNAYPGVTNRMLGKLAKRIFTAYPEADQYFASAKTELTGNPLRQSLRLDQLIQASQAREHFGLNGDKPTYLSFGGSLGSLSMNLAHEDLCEFWRNHPGLQLIWQTGEGYYARFSESETAQLPNVHATAYLNRMDLAYSAASLVGCRAGALSIAELQLLQKPAILIPSPNVAGDHQTANAKSVAAGGGAVVVHDTQQVQQLGDLLPGLLEDKQRLRELAEGIGNQAHQGSAQRIAQSILYYVANS